MKRQKFTATVAGDTRTAYAWNSAIRLSEAMVREAARWQGAIYTGDAPAVSGEPRVYRRAWVRPDGHTITAEVQQVTA